MAAEEKQDVKQEVEEQDVQPQQEDVKEESSEDVQQNEPVEQSEQETQTGVGQEPDYDDSGVPWKNRAMEFRRKYEDLNSKFSKISEKIDGLQLQNQEQQYSEAQLRAFSQDPNTSSQDRVWAEQEIAKKQEDKLGKVVENKLSAYQKKQKEQTLKQHALQTVQQRHPDAFKKDARGKVVGWNNKSPLTQKIAQYMQDPEVQKNPRGLMVATAMANWDLSQQSQEKNTQLKQEVKNLQKRTMVEGGGKQQEPPKSPTAKALERTRSGEKKDAEAAMRAILKQKGQITE